MFYGVAAKRVRALVAIAAPWAKRLAQYFRHAARPPPIMKISASSRGLVSFLLVSIALHLAALLGPKRPRAARLEVAPAARMDATLALRNERRHEPGEAREHKASPAPMRQPAQAGGGRPASRAGVRPDQNKIDSLATAKTEKQAPASAGAGQSAVADLPSAQPPLDNVGTQSIREYVLLLVPEARKHKHYPPLARERGWQGTAEVSIGLRRMSPLPLVTLNRSSGYPDLDEQALQIVGQAARAVAVPEALRGKDVTIPVPVRFGLDD